MGRYFVVRFMLFIGCVLVFWLAGLRSPIPLVLVSGVVSSIIALFVFREMRNQAATGLEHRVHSRVAKIDEHRAEEDDD